MLCVHFLSVGAFLIQLFWRIFSPSSRYTVLCSPPPPHTVHSVLTFRRFFTESTATSLSTFGPIEGHKWFFQISSQWKSRKNLFHVKKILENLKKNRRKRSTDLLCPQPLSKKIKLRAYCYWVFLQRMPHDRTLPQAKLFNRSNSFYAV